MHTINAKNDTQHASTNGKSYQGFSINRDDIIRINSVPNAPQLLHPAIYYPPEIHTNTHMNTLKRAWNCNKHYIYKWKLTNQRRTMCQKEIKPKHFYSVYKRRKPKKEKYMVQLNSPN